MKMGKNIFTQKGIETIQILFVLFTAHRYKALGPLALDCHQPFVEPHHTPFYSSLQHMSQFFGFK